MKAIIALIVAFSATCFASRDGLKAKCEAYMEIPKAERQLDCAVSNDVTELYLWIRVEMPTGKHKAFFYEMKDGWMATKRSLYDEPRVFIDRTSIKAGRSSALICFAGWDRLRQMSTGESCDNLQSVKEAKQMRKLWEDRFK